MTAPTWHALGESSNPITGNCGDTDNDFCSAQRTRQDAITLVDNPDPIRGPAKMFRYEVKFQDGQFTNAQGVTYSDQRAMSGPPARLWVGPGTEQWWRWFHLVPDNWIGRFPKQDQLYDYDNGRASLDGGSGFQFHHAYADQRTETGSAPLYTGIDDQGPWLTLVDQASSAVRRKFSPLLPIQRMHCYEWLLHINEDPDPAKGFLELWLDGINVIPRFSTQTMYPGTLQYPICGIYRRWSIGDPSLTWPAGTKRAGQKVYGSDGAVQWQYIGGLATGPSRDSVVMLYPTTRGGSVATAPTSSPAAVPTTATMSAAQKADWLKTLQDTRDALAAQAKALQASADTITAQLNRGTY